MEINSFYYIEPSDKVFNDLVDVSINCVWKKYDDTYGYASGKIGRIKSLKNVGDNFMIIWNMMDIFNQDKALENIKFRTFQALIAREGMEYNIIPHKFLKKML